MFFLKPPQYDGVREEIESRKPFFRRELTRATAGIVLISLVWLVFRWLGFDVPFPFHFW
jgi:hypothetical protein